MTQNEYVECVKALREDLTPLQQKIFNEILDYIESKVYMLKCTNDILQQALLD